MSQINHPHTLHPHHPTAFALAHGLEVVVKANKLPLMPTLQLAQHKGLELHLDTFRIACTTKPTN